MSKTMTKTKLANNAAKPSPKSANNAANIQTARHMDVRNVPLASLTLDPGNVRKSRASERETAELAASIATVGLITPLGCFEISKGKKGKYSVVAGGRRLAALQQLAAEKKLPASLEDGIPIVVFYPSGHQAIADMTEISLAENVVRADMTAVDQIEAWGKLHADGMAAQTIAARFGVAEGLVKQRLRLAGVAKPILDAFRDETIDIDELRAFALTDDQTRQIEVFEAVDLDHWNLETIVRRQITNEAGTLADRMARFVGLDAYRAAGGAVLQDLFCEDDRGIILSDGALLESLAAEKLATIHKELEAKGWKWVEHVENLFSNKVCEARQLNMEGAVATAKEAARLDKIEETYDDEDADRDALEAEQDQIETAIAARGYWSDEQKAIAGVFYCIDHYGQISIRRGYVLASDDPTRTGSKAGTQDKPLLSAKLAEDLGKHRTQITQAHLMQDTQLAYDILVYNLAITLLGGWHQRIGSIIVTENHLAHQPDELPCGDAIIKGRDALNLEWASREDDGERFTALRAIPEPDKQALLAYCVAASINVRLADTATTNSLDELVVGALPIDWAAVWRPDVGFWNRLTKAGIEALVSPVLGGDWIKAHITEKKGTLAARLGDIFAGKAKSITPEQTAAVLAWQVPGMETGMAPVNEDTGQAPNPKTEPDATGHENLPDHLA